MAEKLDLDALERDATRLLTSSKEYVDQLPRINVRAQKNILALISRIRELESAIRPGIGWAVDAERWRTAVGFIGARYSGSGSQEFTISYVLAVGAGNLMKGSVAEHFTNAIDRETAKRPARVALSTGLHKFNPATPSNVDELIAPAAPRADEVDAEAIDAGLDRAEGNLSAAADADPHGGLPITGSILHDSRPILRLQAETPACEAATLYQEALAIARSHGYATLNDALDAAIAHKASPVSLMVDMVPPATARDRWMYEQGRLAERDPRSHAAPAQEEELRVCIDHLASQCGPTEPPHGD